MDCGSGWFWFLKILWAELRHFMNELTPSVKGSPFAISYFLVGRQKFGQNSDHFECENERYMENVACHCLKMNWLNSLKNSEKARRSSLFCTSRKINAEAFEMERPLIKLRWRTVKIRFFLDSSNFGERLNRPIGYPLKVLFIANSKDQLLLQRHTYSN
jgi:hypothetical protein